jgi:hypothetical protein
VLADDAYQENHTAVEGFGQQARLIVPVHGRTARADLADGFSGIERFTPSGVPVCEGGHRFDMRGRDIIAERYIWAAPMMTSLSSWVRRMGRDSKNGLMRQRLRRKPRWPRSSSRH